VPIKSDVALLGVKRSERQKNHGYQKHITSLATEPEKNVKVPRLKLAVLLLVLLGGGFTGGVDIQLQIHWGSEIEWKNQRRTRRNKLVLRRDGTYSNRRSWVKGRKRNSKIF